MKFLNSLVILSCICITLLQGCRNDRQKSTKPGDSEVSRQIKKSSPALQIDIHQAALKGDQAQVKAALDGKIPPDTLDADGRTPLMYASFNGHVEIVKMLLDRGASPDVADANGTTPLMMASSGPFPQVVALLLEHKADPDATDKNEHFTALMYAAAEGQLEVVKLLLLYKANPSVKDVDGDDALTFARNNGHGEIVKLLQQPIK